jgi:hypothetical protein
MRRPLSHKKRGNVGVWGAIGLAVVGSLLAWGIFAIVNQAFLESQVTNTAGCGLNSTGGTGGTILYSGCDSAYKIIDGSLQFQLNAVEQLPTAGTILGVMLIVAIVGAFGFLGYQFVRSRM